MTVKTILSAKGVDVITIEPNASLATAAKLLATHHIGAVVVCGIDRRVIGMLSERDIVRALVDRELSVLKDTVGQVMARKVVTCSPDDTVNSIMERMTAGRFRHVPVVVQDRLVGIVSIGDVLKRRVEEMKHESDSLHKYIRGA